MHAYSMCLCMYACVCIYFFKTDVQRTYWRITYVYIYLYIYIWEYTCMCMFILVCVCMSWCWCVRISYFIQTGVNFIFHTNRCTHIEVRMWGGFWEGKGRGISTFNECLHIDVKFSRVFTYAPYKLFINSPYVFCLLFLDFSTSYCFS